MRKRAAAADAAAAADDDNDDDAAYHHAEFDSLTFSFSNRVNLSRRFVGQMDAVQSKLSALNMTKEGANGILKRYKEIGLPNWYVSSSRCFQSIIVIMPAKNKCLSHSVLMREIIARLVDTHAPFSLENMLNDVSQVRRVVSLGTAC